MKGISLNRITPQAKTIATANKFGNTNIKTQQGTTRVLYDTLPIDGRTEFRFFENANLRAFPFTNIGSEGNRLGVGETFVIEDIYFEILDYNGNLLEFAWTAGGQNIFGGPSATFSTTLTSGEIDIYLANSQVVKKLPALVCQQQTNPTSTNLSDEVFNFFTQVTIQPLLEYIVALRTLTYALPTNENNIRCYLRGTASILAPKTTF
jgi:hypothetical protein